MENPGYNYTINNESIQKPDTIVHLGITHYRNYRHLPGCKRMDLLYLLGLKVSALVFFDKIFPKFEAQS
jgi:hypothetical protein